MSSAFEDSLRGLCTEGEWSTRLGLPSTPAAAESIGIARDIALAELTGGRLHLTRVSTEAGVALVRAAKARGVSVTCDTRGVARPGLYVCFVRSGLPRPRSHFLTSHKYWGMDLQSTQSGKPRWLTRPQNAF